MCESAFIFFYGRLLSLLDVLHVGTKDNSSSEADLTTPDPSPMQLLPYVSPPP